METDKISIVVPAYNIEHYIESTVKSICDQTYRNLEIILVDDGSMDHTPEILDRLAEKDNRIFVIHKRNGGVTSARLCGVEVATGEWIGFVDGDDFIEPEMYEILIENAKKYGADISHCGYQMVFPNRVDYYYNTGRLAEQDNLTGLKDLLEGSFIEPGLWNKLFHRTLFHSLLHDDVIDCTIKNYEDLLMNYYLFQFAKKSVYYDICPYHYVLRPNSAATSVVNEHKLRDPIRVMSRICKETVERPELNYLTEKRLTGQMIDAAVMPLGQQPDLISPFRREMRGELRKRLPYILGCSNMGFKLKSKALWASIWPASYCFAHTVYAKARGLDRKYSVE